MPILAAFLLAALTLDCTSTPDGSGEVAAPDPLEVREVDQTFHARRTLLDARMFRREGRLEAAERALERGLRVSPDDARLNRMMGEVLDELGREGGDAYRRRADEIEPPPPPLPHEPLDAPVEGLLVILVPSDPDDVATRLTPPTWPDNEVLAALERRFALRMPAARLVYTDPETVDAARLELVRLEPTAVISVRVERAYCGDTLKDGRFAVGQLRIAAERRGTTASGHGASVSREVVNEPRLPIGCKIEATARALEAAFSLPGVLQSQSADAPGDGASPIDWPTESLRALFPGLALRIDEHLEAGRDLLAGGHISDAAAAFRRAESIDRADPTVRAYLEEVDATLDIAHQLSPKASPRSGVVLDPRFSPERERALESQLAAERRRRDDLLAALAVLEESALLPPMDVLSALRPSEIADPDAFGPTLAARKSRSAITARVAFAPDGNPLARYFFAAGEALPFLREEDTTFDGSADRWTHYQGSVRREVWESWRSGDSPDVHLVFGSDGTRLLRIELDTAGDGQTDRVFHYASGALERETRDTTGDGRMNRVDRFDGDGNLDVSERDLDGDGNIDVRDFYEAGRLMRRELTKPEDAQ